MVAQPPTIKQIKKGPRVSTQKETEGLNTKRDRGSQHKKRLHSQGSQHSKETL